MKRQSTLALANLCVGLTVGEAIGQPPALKLRELWEKKWVRKLFPSKFSPQIVAFYSQLQYSYFSSHRGTISRWGSWGLILPGKVVARSRSSKGAWRSQGDDTCPCLAIWSYNVRGDRTSNRKWRWRRPPYHRLPGKTCRGRIDVPCSIPKYVRIYGDPPRNGVK